MESSFSALTATTTTSATARALRLFTISKALNCRFSAKSPFLLARPDLPSQLVARQVRYLYTNCLSRPNSSVHPFLPSSSLRGLFAAVPEVRRRLERISNSTKSFGTAAGGGGGGLDGVRGGGGGGGDGCGGGDSNSELSSGAGQEGSTLLPDVIILDVGGMTCGGCAASVKRILESQPQVSSANVNLTTETAIVWPVSEAKVVPNWQQQLGEALAQHLSRNLEQRAKIKATSDMTGLLSVLPSKARLLVNGDAKETSSIVEVPCNSLSVGDQIVVLPGDRVPADGTVRAGRSTIDESSFTGELMPVTKLPGSQVAAGSINLNGTLTVEVHRPGGETAIGDIVRLVEEAQSNEAPVQRLADKVSGHFTYGVMALSAATFMFWNLFGTHVLPIASHHGSTISLALQLSCSVLVVACPCALGLATPTAMLVGTSLGARKGLLLRGGNTLEKFSLVNTVVFDKTGTLTVGRPVVTKVVTSRDSSQNLGHAWSEVEVLRLAAGVESNTIHPVGKAIVGAAQAANCQNTKVLDGTFTEEPGSGAVAIIDNKRVSVGTLDWVQRNGVGESPLQVMAADELNSQSVVYVGVENTLAGLIYFQDRIREDAGHVVESLSRQGISVYMLSGDKRSTAEYVASVVGIAKEKVLSEVKPGEKKKFISELQKSRNIVAMVGDGINDAAALASSDVGVAMGGGVGAASEVSSVVLMGNRLSQLLDAMELSRLTMKTVKQNLWWAFGYNIIGIPIAAGVLLPVTGTMLTPSIAGALMGLSSLGVMANSLLLRIKFSSTKKQMYGDSSSTKTYSNSDVHLDCKETTKHPFSDPRWKGA